MWDFLLKFSVYTRLGHPENPFQRLVPRGIQIFGNQAFVCFHDGKGVLSVLSGLRLARNEGMDPYSSPYVASFGFVFHSFIPSLNPKP